MQTKRPIDWGKIGNAVCRGFGAAAGPTALLLAPLPIPHWVLPVISGVAGTFSALTSVYELWKTPPYLDNTPPAAK